MTRRALVLALTFTAAACGTDLTGAMGDEGHLYYSLVTDYEVPGNDLRTVSIVTGYTQRIHVRLTDEGREFVAERADEAIDELGRIGGKAD